MSDRVYEGLKEVTGPDGFIRGTRSVGSLQLTKYDALFDRRPVFNAIREDFAIHGDGHTPQYLLETIAIMLQTSENVSSENNVNARILSYDFLLGHRTSTFIQH